MQCEGILRVSALQIMLLQRQEFSSQTVVSTYVVTHSLVFVRLCGTTRGIFFGMVVSKEKQKQKEFSGNEDTTATLFKN
jgi:hypothetical protein